MTYRQEVATDANPAVPSFNTPGSTTVQNGYDYDSAIRRRAEGINAIGQGANDYSKQLADRRVEAQSAKIQADAITRSAAMAQANARKQPETTNTSAPRGAGQSFKPGYANQMSVIDKMFPGVKATSGYRPGAITASGNQSFHASGRAVDLPPTMAIYNWIKANYPNSKELIFAGGKDQIKNGKIVPASFYGSKVMSGHGNHIHWAY